MASSVWKKEDVLALRDRAEQFAKVAEVQCKEWLARDGKTSEFYAQDIAVSWNQVRVFAECLAQGITNLRSVGGDECLN